MEEKYPPFVKYERIPHLDEVPHILDRDVFVFEKLDGGNVQVRKHKGRILAGNRSNYLSDKFVKSREHIPECRWFGDFLRWAMGNYSLLNIQENFVVFGEWLAKHALDYDLKNKDKFYVLDILDLNTGNFVFCNRIENLLRGVGVRDVKFLRPLFKGKINKDKLEKLVDKSDYRNGKSEGVVIKDYNAQEFAKLWEKTINRKKRTLSYEDVRRAIMTMAELDLTITRDNVFNEIKLDLDRQKIHYSDGELRKIVNRYFDNPSSLH